MDEVEFRNRVDEVARSFGDDLAEALRGIGELKDRMNELELGAGEDRNMSNKDELSHMTDKLNGLIDSLISKSDLHWGRYRELAEECETHAFCPSSLEGLEEICERTEGLARDLLCYSLGRFRRRDL